ncbi:RNA polymerase sigma factor [Paenibacillus sp. CGMCC 1.16610]|uniref:Sigma-70 family RNA polymerase sigma factor n=1 Tax=Paenibacillus anseongense TaxID=2682845 RepID=A0ABW9UF69_9BACL|nr:MULTISPECIES: RNA polymerase sigma factor [Paenibacillus]MBA2938616.1 RNA polymerase sigma factor [Paenibacillus sp. CGMCC 1.16610]MVQ38807.1 sigma-70 family RNA polymerase sigma factor [Paenibacillus anseongense]
MMRDDAAFNALYEQYYTDVYYFTYSVLKDHFLAQDAVQETFLKVFRYFNSIKVEEKKASWLFTITRNTAIDFYRKRLKSLEISHDKMESIAIAAEAEALKNMEKKSIHEQISALEPQFQQSLLLVYEHGLTYEQLAAHQNTTVSAVKSKLHRAKKKLRSLAQ